MAATTRPTLLSLPQWPGLEQRNPTPISLVEIVSDLCLTFQTRLQVHLQVTKVSGPDVPVLAAIDPAKYYLPTRKMGKLLPAENLKQTSHTFLRTFDYLQPIHPYIHTYIPTHIHINMYMYIYMIERLLGSI